MGRLNVYLSGPVKNVDGDFQNWRKRLLTLQEDDFYPDLNFIDPISYFNYTDKQPRTDKQCLDLFMWQVEKCDVILINLDGSDNSIGEAMEVEHAFCHGIPIIAFGKESSTWYNWVKTRATVIFDDLHDAVDYICDSYAEIVI